MKTFLVFLLCLTISPVTPCSAYTDERVRVRTFCANDSAGIQRFFSLEGISREQIIRIDQSSLPIQACGWNPMLTVIYEQPLAPPNQEFGYLMGELLGGIVGSSVENYRQKKAEEEQRKAVEQLLAGLS